MEVYGYDPNLEWHHDSAKWACPYNEGVSCTTRKCVGCGWNPSVDRRRREQMMSRMEVGR
jgi:hypothetical protein